MQGYIKDYRKELDSDIWLMPPLYHRTWQYLKYQVNHQENKIPMRDGSFLTIKKGQHLTSVRDIAKSTGWYEGAKWKEANPKTVDTILKWLEKHNMISIDRGKGNRQYTLISLLNWDSYQHFNDEGNNKVTVDGEGGKHLADINKNEKECIKNEKNITAAENAREGESDGVPTTVPNRDSLTPAEDKEEISHTPEDYQRVILNKYIQLRNSGFQTSVSDETAAVELYESNIPLEKAIYWLLDRFKTYKPKHQRDKINSLSYCVPYILDKYHAEIQKHERSLRNEKLAKRSIPDRRDEYAELSL
ncbi:hypothetical protein [Fictibacillus sp. 23RED33]|uniref:hypothetical protein n=1 Tax=Fictibacillus sp. 23RED33 TaxID=2745879 RepID=UPI00351C51BA